MLNKNCHVVLYKIFICTPSSPIAFAISIAPKFDTLLIDQPQVPTLKLGLTFAAALGAKKAAIADY